MEAWETLSRRHATRIWLLQSIQTGRIVIHPTAPISRGVEAYEHRGMLEKTLSPIGISYADGEDTKLQVYRPGHTHISISMFTAQVQLSYILLSRRLGLSILLTIGEVNWNSLDVHFPSQELNYVSQVRDDKDSVSAFDALLITSSSLFT